METFEVTTDVYGIDTGQFGGSFISVYLFDDAEPTLVDSGTESSADTVADRVDDLGVPPEELENIVLSHVHADHSGGAGSLLEYAPNADVYIHEMTAPHLADPAGLIESSREAMGEHFEAMGEQLPVPEANIVPVSDEGTTIDIGTNSLELVYAPGHSPDHFAVWNPERRLCFAAECLGAYLEEVDQWISPSTVPNFDVEAAETAIDRVEALDPDRIIFPHFGVWPKETDVAFETARRELHRFGDRISELYETTESIEATHQAVADELIDIAPPYDERIESFYSGLITDGYLKYQGVDI